MIDPRINNGQPFDPFGVLVENGPTFSALRRAKVALTVGATATSSPVQMPACAATAAIVATDGPFPVAFALDAAGAPAAAVPVAYSTTGSGGSAGDQQVAVQQPLVVWLTSNQKALLAAGNLYLTATHGMANNTATFTVTFCGTA